jgi:hypothetical protein
MNIFTTVSDKFLAFDGILTDTISVRLSSYIPNGDVPYLSSHVPLFIKIALYSSFIILPSAICKVIYPDSKKLTAVAIVIMATVTIMVILIFLGFLQLLYD